MIIPIRCFTCNKEISSNYSKYVEKIKSGVSTAAALDDIGITRLCCRRMYLTNVDIADQLLNFEKYENSDYLQNKVNNLF